MGLFGGIFSRNQYKQGLAQWIVDHNNRAYLGIGPLSTHSVDYYYFDCTVEELEAKKARMQGVHQKYEKDKAPVIIQGFVCDAPAWHEFEIEDDTDDD